MSERLSCPKCKAPLEEHEVVSGVVVYPCPSCFGVLYDKEVLAVPLKLTGLAPSRWDCPRCRKAMDTGKAYDGHIEVDRCASCQAVWFDAGEIQILRKLTGVENLAGRRDSDEPEPAAPAAPKAAPPPPARGGVPVPVPEVKSSGPKEMTGVVNMDAIKAPTVEYQGRVYQHFQTSMPTTTAVLGEFPWVATVGDSARMRDFICPPYMISEEVTGKESVWTAGEYVEPEEIWAAFSMPGNPPPKSGVGAAQPNPWSAHLLAVWSSFIVAAGVCAAGYVLIGTHPSGRVVYDGNFSVAATDAERSRVTDVFEVTGRTSNLDINLDTNLDGRWAYVAMALIEADTDKAIDFGKEISYYHGYEDGESWSEGSSRESVIVPSVPAGRYYLRVEPETDSPGLNIHATIRRDVPLLRLPFIAILLLLIPAVWGAIRQGTFENARWMESDHPRTSSDEDDE